MDNLTGERIELISENLPARFARNHEAGKSCSLLRLDPVTFVVLTRGTSDQNEQQTNIQKRNFPDLRRTRTRIRPYVVYFLFSWVRLPPISLFFSSRPLSPLWHDLSLDLYLTSSFTKRKTKYRHENASFVFDVSEISSTMTRNERRVVELNESGRTIKFRDTLDTRDSQTESVQPLCKPTYLLSLPSYLFLPFFFASVFVFSPRNCSPRVFN